MDQQTSGWRVWFWGVLGLLGTGVLVLVMVLSSDNYQVNTLDPQFILVTLFFLALAVGVGFLTRGKNEEKEDMS